MFYYDVDEFLNRSINREFLMYSERDFERLVNWQYDKDGNSIMPFRDEYSKKFLRDTWNIEFVNDDDWYSIQSPEEGRFSLSGLSKEMKYALTLLHFSRNGQILSFKSCSKRIWKALSDMPFDILIAVDTSRLSSWYEICLGTDYIIEHFPFNNEFVQVNVVDGLVRGKKEVKDKNGVRLFAEDDKYYAASFSIESYFTHYSWKKHLPDIIKSAVHCIKKEYPIVNKILTCNVMGYAKALNLKENYFLDFNEYAYEVFSYERLLNEGEISQKEFDDIMSKCKSIYVTDYKEFMWVKDELEICSHLYALPDETIFRKLPMMIIDKYSDGSYKIWGKLTVKYPRFEEILFDVIHDYYTNECERYITVVDIEEVFQSASDIKRTNCGFKITENCIEIFDRNDALKMFVDMAQEAISSDNCSISDEFY